MTWILESSETGFIEEYLDFPLSGNQPWEDTLSTWVDTILG